MKPAVLTFLNAHFPQGAKAMKARPTEVIARDIMQGIFQEIEDLCNPANDGMVAPWEMAERKLHAAAHACHEAAADIKKRPAALRPIFQGITDGFRLCGS